MKIEIILPYKIEKMSDSELDKHERKEQEPAPSCMGTTFLPSSSHHENKNKHDK